MQKINHIPRLINNEHMLDHRRKIQPAGKKRRRNKHMRRLSRITHTRTRRHRPTRLQKPIEMVIRPAFARFCTTSERDAFDTAVVEECSELLHFAAFIAEDEEFGEFDGAGTGCSLGMHESIFCPYATDAALNVCVLIPACP
jgi:hypothetical protein